MPEVKNRKGIWVIYNFDTQLHALFITDDSNAAITELANMGDAKLGFWPFGLSLTDAVGWWESAGRQV